MGVKVAEVVRSRDGLRGVLEPSAAGAGAATRVVRFDDGRTVVVSSTLLKALPEGGYELPLDRVEIEALAGGAGRTTATATATTTTKTTTKARAKTTATAAAAAGEACAEAVGGRVESGDLVVPVVEEHAEVATERVETGRVKVSKKVTEHTEVVDLPLSRETVEVERVKLDRVVEAATGPRHEGDTLVVPVYEEVLVVEKRLMLREELRITTRREETRSHQDVTLRKEEAVVDRSGPGGPKNT